VNIDEVSAAQLKLMCDQHWSESGTMDFKRTLPAKDDRGRREWLKDVCAFANAGGGTIYLGIDEKDGAADSISPITDESSDAAILRLGQIVDAGVEPRLRGVRFKPVEVAGGFVLVAHLPASFDGPHRYLVNDASRFVMRSGRHTIDMNYQQLRSAFGNTVTLLDRARAFRERRLASVPSVRMPLSLRPGPITLVHLVPIEAMSGRASVDVTPVYYDYSDLSFSDWGGGSRMLNLDGVLSHVSSEEHTNAYTLLFRTGVIESCRFSGLTIRDDTIIPSLTIADFLHDALPQLAKVCRRVGMSGPALFGVAMLRVGEFRLAINQNYVAGPPDRADLVFPEIWIDDVEALPPVDDIVKPILDLLWQAFGHPNCGYYNKDGKYAPRR